MSREPRPAEAPAAPWELQLLLLAAAAAVLPELFDVDAFKIAAVSLLAAALLLPRLAVLGTDDVRAWFGCAGGRLQLLAAALALPPALSALPHAGVTDRLLMTALAALAAVLGLRAARAGLSLPRALHAATLVVAVACLLQAAGLLGLLTALDPQGFPEVVGTLGNSTRAGALLALGVTAAFAALAAPDAREPRWRERLAAAALNLGTAALLLTRARAGWLAAAAGLAVVAWLSRRELTRTWKACAVPLAVGALLALILGDGARLLAPKLERDTALLSAQDATAGVRLAVWRGTLRMIAAAPLSGHGLGLFRREFAAFREPGEAALPGREGLPTEVDHPHNELLLPCAEGGLPAGLCLLACVALTLARAARRAGATATGAAADGGLSGRAALGLLVAGGVTGMLQNAWTTPGTALPFFAAAGWAWQAGPGPTASGPGARTATRALLVLLLAGLVLLALPRARTHVQWWRFFRDADAHGVNLDNFARLEDAADASPGDVDIQARLAHVAGEIRAEAPAAAGAVQAPLERAQARLARLRAAR